MKKNIFLFIFIMVFLTNIFPEKLSKSGEVSEIIGKVTTFVGNIIIITDNKARYFNGFNGSIYNNDKIVVKSGRCKLVLIDKSNLILDKGTVISIAMSGEKIKINNYIGSLFFKVVHKNKPDLVSFFVPGGIMGIRGTEGVIRVFPDGKSLAGLKTGKMAVYNVKTKKAVVELSAGKSSTIMSNGTIHPVQKFSCPITPDINLSNISLSNEIIRSPAFEIVDMIMKYSILQNKSEYNKRIKDKFLSLTTYIKMTLKKNKKYRQIKYINKIQSDLLKTVSESNSNKTKDYQNMVSKLSNTFNLLLNNNTKEANNNINSVKKHFNEIYKNGGAASEKILNTFNSNVIKLNNFISSDNDLQQSVPIRISLLDSINESIDLSLNNKDVNNVEKLYIPFEEAVQFLKVNKDAVKNDKIIKSFESKKELVNTFLVRQESYKRSFQKYSW